MMENQRKIWYDQNDQPPKNYIWYKNGQYLEWIDGRWKPSEGINGGIKEDMTEEQQMAVRKNLDLYYEETTVGEKTAKYTNEEQSATLSGYSKVSDDIPSKEDIIKVVMGGQLWVFWWWPSLHWYRRWI